MEPAVITVGRKLHIQYIGSSVIVITRVSGISEASTPALSMASGSLLTSNTYDSLSLRGELEDYHGERSGDNSKLVLKM